MGITFGMHVVEPVHHLMEVGAGDLLGKFTSFGNEVEQLTAANIFKDDGEAGEGRLILAFVCGIFFHID